jgi:hypothetical protein
MLFSTLIGINYAGTKNQNRDHNQFWRRKLSKNTSPILIIVRADWRTA